MTGKNNLEVRRAKLSQKVEKFGIRRFKVGTASVLIGAGLFFNANFVSAQTVTDGTLSDSADSALVADANATEAEMPLVDTAVSSEVNADAIEETPVVAESNTETVGEEAATEETPVVAESNTDTVEEEAATELAETTEAEIAESVEESTQLPETTIVDTNTAVEDEPINDATTVNEPVTLLAESAETSISEEVTEDSTPVTSNSDEAVNTIASNEKLSVAAATNNIATDVEPIEEGMIRLHFENLPEDKIGTLGIWYWGGVENESGNHPDGWPKGATLFDPNKKDEYGYYIDIAQSANPADIGFLLLDTAGTDDETIKITPTDQTVKLLTGEMNEAWIDADFQTNSYQPLKDENVLRINYLRSDNNYENLGVWSWFDVENPPQNWPTEALMFEQEGQYGRYVDLPLSQGLESSIGFLIVNTADGSKPLTDLAFSDRITHSQIFLRDNDQTVYTNPYFVAENKVDPSTATPGVHNVTVEASVNKEVESNHFALLDVTITNPDNAEIKQIIADTSALGTSAEVKISPELNRVTITATHDTKPGEYQIPIRVYDADNGYYETTASVVVKEHVKAEGELDWDEQVIYFMLTDRFFDGDSTNNNPYNLPYESAKNQGGVYRGGDFKGVTAKLDYLKELGVTSIWVTPIVENIKYNVGGTDNVDEFYAYHGYWASDFEELNPHLGSLADFHELIDEAAARGINILVDVVLNHPGYGLNKGDSLPVEGFPTAEDQERFADLIRQEEGMDPDTQRSLSGLPDFETERHEVREQLVAWQSQWLEKATTSKGNSIYGFRVDTVKNVDNTTWQHFKNVLTELDSDFHLIGESWGANYTNDNDDLGEGKMDSLLDFGFKEIAKQLVNGDLTGAQQELINRNGFITNAESLAQFLSSHDEDGFTYSLDGDLNKQKIAATIQLTAKGLPVIYYGEELGLSGVNNWPYYDNRYQFDWDKVEGNEMHEHYTKLLDFRNDHSELMSRGDRATLAGNNSEKWLIAKRSYNDQSAYIATNLNETATPLTIEVSGEDAVLFDHYSGNSYNATLSETGQYVVNIEAPAINDGGTLLLTVTNGDIINAKLASEEEPPVEEGMLRIHFKELPDQAHDTLGLWTWGDVATPSEQLGSWPTGATNFGEARQDDYGYYLDVRKSSLEAKKINYLINNNKGDNITGDQSIDIISPTMDEVWIDADWGVNYYKPIETPNTVRINYYRTDGNYDNLGLWTWGSSENPGENWPDGIDLDREGEYGYYADVKLSDLAELGFLIVDESTGEKVQEQDFIFKDLENHSQLFIRDNDPKIYTNPYYVSQIQLNSAEQLSENTIELQFSSTEGLTNEELLSGLTVTSSTQQSVTLDSVAIQEGGTTVLLTGDFAIADAPFGITFEDITVNTRTGWRLTDEVYGYDGDLGMKLNETGTIAEMNLWSPSAQEVNVVVYDKDDNNAVVGRVAMTASDKGVWNVKLDAGKDLGLETLTNYLYHYEIIRDGKKYLVLDPYAKSMGAWDNTNPMPVPEDVVSKPVGKAAFVAPDQLGPKLDFANIEGYKKREDAIIYEAHVRDFTSDPNIADELTAQFGTFAAFVERLDYLQDLGVTHIQLLPVMNYYNVNELINDERLLEYASSDSNYNWGYDPQNYFALTGMYSEDPTNPSKRIEEFKNLVNEIHKRGMGVILDVVYNHTAQVHIFEDLEPNYYHFMKADGTPKESFGGGRLGTTHKMARRVLVDSIKYLVDEYKVDGFRFDMMGDHDAASIEEAYNAAKALNPNILMLGEGWVTYEGDDGLPEQPADQTWMQLTDGVASFSDEIRNELKSGFGSEGQPRFLTNGARNLELIFNNIIGRPSNFKADDPGDVIQYIAAHDNLTLFDVIAQSIKKDPKDYSDEILRRVRLGNSIILTSQGTPFIHSGQEYGRTKQYLHPDYRTTVSDDLIPNKATYMVDADGNPFEYPYFIHDSYDSSDAINRFDWEKATNAEKYAENVLTHNYTRGLIAIRRSTDAFSHDLASEIDEYVSLITVPNTDPNARVEASDLIIGYQAKASNGDIYAVFINADDKERTVNFGEAFKHLADAKVIADAKQAGTSVIETPEGVVLDKDSITLDGLTTAILLIKKAEEIPGQEEEAPGQDGEAPGQEEAPGQDGEVPGQEEETPGQEGEAPGQEEAPDQEEETPSKEKETDAKAKPIEKVEYAAVLPNTGEKVNTSIFTAAALSVLVGLGLIVKKTEEEQE